MNIASVLVLIGISLFVGLSTRGKSRVTGLFITSIITVFAFQPALPIRGLDFWLPVLTLLIAVISWAIVNQFNGKTGSGNWISVIVMVGIVLLLGATRFLPFSLPITASPPPRFHLIAAVTVLFLCLFLLIHKHTGGRHFLSVSLITFILLILVVLKYPDLSYRVAIWLYKINQQHIGTVSSFDIRWLGYSYIAFRLIHTIYDGLKGVLPSTNLAEYITYIIFFPSFTAGPIDRLERFITDLRQTRLLISTDLFDAGKRILIGMVKKFVIADTLAMIALNDININQVNSPGWMWVLLYAYSFQIFFDFSGYTDIAIGLGRLVGVKLPENFNSPYTSSNLTIFWNRWHITLTQWLRIYFFNPFTRFLRTKTPGTPTSMVIFITQLTTMVLIGAWHGITWNYILWGLWHGVGVFIQNRWSSWIRPRSLNLKTPWKELVNFGNIALTFNYVSLGWIFFALPGLHQVWRVLAILFNIGE